MGSEYQNNHFLFATEVGTPIRDDNLRGRDFKPAFERAGLPKTIRLVEWGG